MLIKLLGRTHFDQGLDFLDLFMPINISSQERARAFLWLVYHYLEDPDHPTSSASTSSSHPQNPFHPTFPPLHMLSASEMGRLGENIDLPEEIEWGNRMCNERMDFLQRLTHMEAEKKRAEEAGEGAGKKEVKGKTRFCAHVNWTWTCCKRTN